MRQSDLEAEMRDSGISRYRKNVSRATQHELESQTPVGRRLLTESVGLLSLAIRDWKRGVERHPVGARSAAYPYINMLDTDLVAGLTARSVINSITMHEKLTKSAFKVSRMLEDECRWRELRDKHPSIWMKQKEMAKKIPSYNSKRRFLNNTERFVDLQFARWPRSERLKVGIVLIELMKQSTGLIEITTRTGLLGKRDTFVHPTDCLMEWMKEAHNYAEDLSPMYLPMVERCADWKDVYSGGYLTENIHPRPLVKTRDRNHLEDLNAIDISTTMATINKLQRVPWMINERVLDTLLYCWENDIEVGELPSSNGEPIPSKPVDIDTNKESRRRWAKLAARINHENTSNQSRRLQITKILWMAKKFSGHPMYFPWYADFRSRKYKRVHHLQFQGGDEARGLLRFRNGLPIESNEAERWLAIHGANMFGEDRCSLDDRVQWVHNNRDMITAVGEDPRGTTSFWGKADKPWNFLGFCEEWSAYMKQGSGFITHLPVGIDGSSNGLQLYSLLMLDPVGAAATNVLPSDTPRDIYGDVAERTIRRLQESTDPMAKKWLEFGVDRTAAKRPTMVVPYSAQLYSCVQYTIDWFNTERKKRGCENPFGWEEVYAPCFFLANHIWDAIGDVVGKARRVMSWFQDVSNICVECGVPIRWTTPSGFLVKQAYEHWKGQSVRTIIGDVIRQHRVRTGTGKMSRAKNRNGIAPNFIHSIDASIGELSHLKSWSMGVESQVSVHDAFFGLAPQMNTIRDNLLETVVEIFSENLMEKFFEEITHYLPNDVVLPAPPERGDLDIELVRDSLYFYS